MVRDVCAHLNLLISSRQLIVHVDYSKIIKLKSETLEAKLLFF